LARYKVADLFLDTFPYTAHTTASDALWAGCPILTCTGESFASRVSGSLLSALGLPELITQRLEDYRAAALRLSLDAAALSALRRQLEDRKKASQLFNTTRFAREFEKALLEMWQRSQAGVPPDTIDLTAPGGRR
jgi:predicted O-linked N-acetylglucosamine transferase (SPINDLY family)